jgi:hypothetical protein
MITGTPSGFQALNQALSSGLSRMQPREAG